MADSAGKFCALKSDLAQRCVRPCPLLRVTIDEDDSNAHILVDEFDQYVDYRKVDEVQWLKWIDTVIPLAQFVEVVVKEAERNILPHGLVGFSTDWSDQTDVFPISAYLRLKGINAAMTIKGRVRSKMSCICLVAC